MYGLGIRPDDMTCLVFPFLFVAFGKREQVCVKCSPLYFYLVTLSLSGSPTLAVNVKMSQRTAR